ncbi:MAG: efflux RND transporter periplasmic adaptor subunit, partial [Phycisphaeraceae bacterium]|nr:efflux RND transporter periplasmic adaptor subunit [Phycisphaeraceae bacterium]
RATQAVLRGAPTILTLGLLGLVAFAGHKLHWKMPSRASLVSGETPPRKDWCMEHSVPESQCVICRGKPLVPDADGSPAILPDTAEGAAGEKPRPVQFATAESVAKAGVITAPAETRPMSAAVTANAEVGYDMTRYAQVGSRAAGSVTMVRVQAGDRVKAGDLLALIDSAAVGTAKSEYLQAAAQLAARGAAAERLRTSTTAGFRNQADLIAAEADLKDAEIRLFNTQQNLVNLGFSPPALAAGEIPSAKDLRLLGLPPTLAAELDADRTTANLLPIVSPLDGVVISRAIVPGELVESGKALFVVADTSRMWVTASLAPTDARRVAIGQELVFMPDGSTDDAVIGRITWRSTEVDKKTRTVQVRAEVPNADDRILAHTFGRARIAVARADAAVVVPSEAVQWDGTANVVFVRVNSTVFAARTVSLGAQQDGVTEIRSGLRPGERVATAGSYVLVSQLNNEKLGAGCTDD